SSRCEASGSPMPENRSVRGCEGWTPCPRKAPCRTDLCGDRPRGSRASASVFLPTVVSTRHRHLPILPAKGKDLELFQLKVGLQPTPVYHHPVGGGVACH